MFIKNCPACNSPAAIRYKKDDRRHCFHVWIECGQCGRRTREFTDMQEPDTGTGGGKWAVIAWNSGDNGGPGESDAKIREGETVNHGTN